MTDHPAIPAAALAAATTRARLSRHSPTLLGTLHGPGTARALLRLDGGRVRTVETGTRVGQATVAAISEGVVILNDRGRALRLEMPEG